MDKQFQDIMPIEEITIDYSIYFIYLGIFVFLLILIYLAKRFLFKKKELVLTSKVIALNSLKTLDLDQEDSKEVLYKFTLLAKECVKNKDRLEFILKQIEPLKYKKENSKLSDKTKDLLKGYIDDL